jgi:hypothetical protein
VSDAASRTIYFSGSISGGRQDVALYRRIVATLESAGHHVLAGAVASETVTAGGESLDSGKIFQRDLAWIDEAARERGLLVAEVSVPSTGVGYEIAAARYRFGIPVICLWRPAYTKRCTAMVAGDAGIDLLEYEEGDLQGMEKRLLEAISRLRE